MKTEKCNDCNEEFEIHSSARMEKCPCGGTDFEEILFSCCGDDITFDDIGFYPTCKEPCK